MSVIPYTTAEPQFDLRFFRGISVIRGRFFRVIRGRFFRGLIEDHRLQRRNLDCLSTAGILAAQLIINPNAIVACLREARPVLFISERRQGCLLRAPPPTDRVLLRCSAFRTVNLGGYRLILLDEEIPFFHERPLSRASARVPHYMSQSPLLIENLM